MYSLLIVDDEPVILEGMCRLLDWRSYGISHVETARSYDEGLTKAMDLRPDICLFDVCIGDEKGYALINHLKYLGVRANYIMMSGYGEFSYALESMRCGAKEYLLKPVETEKLQKVVERIIVEDLGGSISRNNLNSDIDPVLMLDTKDLAPLIAKAIKMVRDEYDQKITLKTVADKFRMNSTYLGQLFLKETRLKFSEYLMLYRLGKARELLENTQIKISAIAQMVGYPNLNYFYLHFHAYFGISPSEMREGSYNTNTMVNQP